MFDVFLIVIMVLFCLALDKLVPMPALDNWHTIEANVKTINIVVPVSGIACVLMFGSAFYALPYAMYILFFKLPAIKKAAEGLK